MQSIQKALGPFLVNNLWKGKSLLPHDGEEPPPRTRISLPVAHGAEVIRDEFGVPHIYAETERDLFFLHGYCQAQDRLWQMEGLRRVAAGRLAELRADAVVVDRFARTLGWPKLAAEEWEQLQAEATGESAGAAAAAGAVGMLLAFADGVNQFIAECKASGGKGNMLRTGPLPFFFMLAGIEPEPWSPVDTLGILRVLCYQMNHGGQHPAIRQLIANIIGEDDAHRWSRSTRDPAGPEWPPTVPTEPAEPDHTGSTGAPKPSPASARSRAPVPEALLHATLAGQPSERELPTQGQGSNWWALGAERTDSGGPLLANDPHLSVSVPSIWYESYLEAKDTGLRTKGVQVPGFPCTIIGHNDDVAVGVTLSYTDCEDLFIERFIGKVSPELGVRTSYEHGGLIREAVTRTEHITVKGQSEPEVLVVVETVHGPVVSQCAGDHAEAYAAARDSATERDDEQFSTHDADGVSMELSFSAKGLAPRTGALEALYTMAHATDVATARGAFENVAAPSLNIGLADRHGNIGYALVGRVPVRGAGCPAGGEMLPLEGWTGDNDWVGDTPWDLMPHSLNPSEGKIVSANHRIVPTTDPDVYLGDIWVSGWRAIAIHDGLEALNSGGEKIGLDDCQALQLDYRCVPGERLRDCFATSLVGSSAAEALSPTEAEALAAFVAWDGRMEKDSVGATLYEVAYDAMADEIFEAVVEHNTAALDEDDVEGLAARERLLEMAKGSGLLLAGGLRGRSELKNGIVSTVLSAMAEPEAWYIEREQVMVAGLRSACRFLETNIGPSVSDWEWGRLHACHFNHQLASTLGDFLNVPPFASGGNSDTIAQVSIGALTGETVPSQEPPGTASYRVLYDPLDWDSCRNINPVGQSEKFGAVHYHDQTEMWAAGEMKPMRWSREAVEAAARTTMEVLPTQARM